MIIKSNMTRENFIEIIDAIKTQWDYDIEFAKNMTVCFPDSWSANLMYNNQPLFTACIKALAVVMNCDVDTLDWWMYEHDFGSNDLRMYENDVEIDLSDAGKLYDYLTQTT
jgi:hypothetical protein